MDAAIFESLKKRQLAILQENLPATLTYHTVFHTIDVLEQAEKIAAREGITDVQQLLLLKTAALFHDAGFLETYKDHEMQGCAIARKTLVNYCSETEMDQICSMIMATKIPQSPASHLAEILCDADLDYLGRDDFYPIADTLRQEFLQYGIVKDDREWEEKQIGFLLHHSYFTGSSKLLRENVKHAYLVQLQAAYDITATD